MTVAKIFKILIIVVACIIVGALILNVVLPNATTGVMTAIEGGIYNATGLSMDLDGANGDGKASSSQIKNNGTIKSTADDPTNKAASEGVQAKGFGK